jgi:phospholipid transport system substrate-binding protein
MTRFLLSLCTVLILAAGPAGATVVDPLDLVRQTADEVLAEVKERKQELTESPGKIYGLVEDIVLPRFDFERMSMLVLGKHWRTASEQQRAEFVVQFRELLVRTYASALLNYSDQEIRYLPVRQVEGAQEVTIATEVSSEGAPRIPISYALYSTGETWKVFDVTIDGVSLVSNYRTTFASQIRRYQLDGLIAKLAERNTQDK